MQRRVSSASTLGLLRRILPEAAIPAVLIANRTGGRGYACREPVRLGERLERPLPFAGSGTQSRWGLFSTASPHRPQGGP